MPCSGSASRRDGAGPLVAPHPAPLLLHCLVAPASMPTLLGQSPLTIASRRRARTRHLSRHACDANFQAKATPKSSAKLLVPQGLAAWRAAEEALTEERRHGCRSDEAVQQERSRMRSDERLLSRTPSREASR